MQNQLVILTLNVLSPPAGFNDPTVPTSTNPWTLVNVTGAGTDYLQYTYWHAISSAEAAVVPTFQFSFTTGAMVATSVRSTGVAIVYENTCTQTTPTPCFTNAMSPILDTTTGMATSADSVTETADLNVQANGIAVCAFGTSNTSVGFPTPPTSPTTLSFENGNAAHNGGLDLYDRFEPSTGTDGAWEALLGGVSQTGDNVAQCVSLIPIGY